MKEYSLRNTILLYLMVSVSVFIKILLFHWFCFDGLMFSSLWRNPVAFGAFYLPKISAAMFIGSFVFMFKSNRWIYIVLPIIDIWMLANFIYYRSYGSFLDIYALSLAGNMKGFWGSVIFYIDWCVLSWILITPIVCVIYKKWFSNNKKRQIPIGVVALAISWVVSWSGVELFRKQCAKQYFVAEELDHWYSSLDPRMRARLMTRNVVQTTRQFSILHIVVNDMIDFIERKSNHVMLTDEDISTIQQFIQHNQDVSMRFTQPLIIIIVESLEDWAVDPQIMPNLSEYINKHKTLRVKNITSQVGGGNSMDGQMILNTGLLPIHEGSVSFLFPENKFPSIAECKQGEATVIVPHPVEVWNQMLMSKAFGYDTTISVLPDETLLFDKAIECINQGYQIIQVITMASHAPFTDFEEQFTLRVNEDMPKYLGDYIKALNYTDACMSDLLTELDTASYLSDAVLVVTGDHKIFYPKLREEYQAYCDENQLNYNVSSPYCPLIISSNTLPESKILSEEVYGQIDIYPTIVSCLGIEHYYNGLGINMLEYVCSGGGRMLPFDQAKDLSDKIIRSNYFERYYTK